MSKPGDYRDYYRQVELHWSLGRGNQIIVSPLEFDFIQNWYESGVPLQVVLRAMDRFLERKKKSTRKRAFLLGHVEGDVKKLMDEYRQLHLGTYNESQLEVHEHSDDLVFTKLKALHSKIKKCTTLPLDWLSQELKAFLEPTRFKQFISGEEVEKELETLNARLIQSLEEVSSSELLQELREELSEFLDEKENPDFFQKAYNDQLRNHYGIPRLTILG